MTTILKKEMNKEDSSEDEEFEFTKEEFQERLDHQKLKFLKLLAQRFPNILSCKVEIVNLLAILELPRGTEHFISDVHGSFEAFNHILRNASGLVRQIIDEKEGLNLLSTKEKKELATLIYYPKERLKLNQNRTNDWYKMQIRRILLVLKGVTMKYTRSKVRKALPKKLGYIIQELLTEKKYGTSHMHQMVKDYFESIVDNICEEHLGEDIIIAMSRVIQKLGVENLHLVGDIFDRGDGAEDILDYLCKSQPFGLTIEFGNHDIIWMSAACGSPECMMNVLRISLRYGNLKTLETGYGISLNPLRAFVKKHYHNLPYAKTFGLKGNKSKFSKTEMDELSQMQKAIFVLQMKLESFVIKNHKEYQMEDRLLLEKIDFKTMTIEIDGKKFEINDKNFPTIDPKDPTKLTKEEEELVEYFKSSFLKSEKLHKHIDFLFRKGSLYRIVNNNIMYHACIPIEKDEKGNLQFKEVNVKGKMYKGKALLDRIDFLLKKAYTKRERITDHSLFFFLWCNENSPLFGKKKMATFERYLINDKTTWKEENSCYFKSRDDPRLLDDLIFPEFGIDPKCGHAIVGHVPVKKNDDPVKLNGKYLSIDGGLSMAYQGITGKAGYTLRADSKGLYLCTHSPFRSTQNAIEHFVDLNSEIRVLEKYDMKVKDTDIGRSLIKQIQDCRDLIKAYKQRKIRQHFSKKVVVAV